MYPAMLVSGFGCHVSMIDEASTDRAKRKERDGKIVRTIDSRTRLRMSLWMLSRRLTHFAAAVVGIHRRVFRHICARHSTSATFSFGGVHSTRRGRCL